MLNRGRPGALSAQSKSPRGPVPPSFSERLEQAARAAAGPLRALTNPVNPVGSNPRGDEALNQLPRTSLPPTHGNTTGRYSQKYGPGQNQNQSQNQRTRRPTTQSVPNQNTRQKPKSTPREKLETFVLKANIILGDGRTVRGRVTFRAPEKIVITHKRDDIEYRKTIRIRDLRSMEITQWKGEPLRKNRKGQWIYRFSPRQSTLTLAGDLVLKENARLLPYFEKLTVRNSNGQVTLFSYWIDLLKSDGSWHTGITGPVNGLRRQGHKDVVQRIEFGDLDEHE